MLRLFRPVLPVFTFLLVTPFGSPALPSEEIRGPAITHERIESDWLVQAKHREPLFFDAGNRLEPRHDAAGGCDGVKNGLFDFHTVREERPWWQREDPGKFVIGTVPVEADGDLEKLAFWKDASLIGHCVARNSKLLAYLASDALHKNMGLDEDDFERLATWLDTYAQLHGSYSEKQEKALEAFRRGYQVE
jgi:hypothetical protein